MTAFTKSTQIVLILFVCIALSGCMELLNQVVPVIYEEQPYEVRFTLRYGYQVQTSGSGGYEIEYRSDLPDLLTGTGSVNSTILYTSDADIEELYGEESVSWSIEDDTSRSFLLAVESTVQKRSWIISDLSGKGALSVDEISSLYPSIAQRYLGVQKNASIRYIDPYDTLIIDQATEVADETTNAFVIARDLFVWLKANTEYAIHEEGDGGVQPARETLLKGTGDCDDLSFLMISLCRSVGVPARLVRGYLLSEDTSSVDAVAHAWVEVFVGGGIGNDGWIPVECACECTDEDVQVHQNFGVEDALHLRMYTDKGTNESFDLLFKGISYRFSSSRDVSVQNIVQVVEYDVVESKQLSILNSTREFKS